jgi:hypothetical protein
MSALSILGLIIMLAANFWFAWEVYQREEIIWAILLFLVPFPVLGLYIWYRAGWSSCYRLPASLYFGAYLLVTIVGKAA